ncbi:MAG: aminotransferase class I/II-fold pyridoxal phosphate-dependent enzyme, partial [Oscillospiraceae bacterium]
MPFELNEKIKNLSPYDPICGEYPIRLDANESFVLPPKNIQNSIVEALSSVSFNRYPDCLATEVCKKFAKICNVSEELVVAGNGSDEIISIIMTAFLQKGDKVITLLPDFSMYKFYTTLVECECKEFFKDENFKVDFESLIDEVNSSKARMVIFSNPCNPTSVGFLADDIKKLIECTDALIVLDEAYMDFWNQSLLSQVQDYDNLIILKTCSKALGFACVRLGFAIANKTLTDVIKAAKSPYNVNS